MKSEIKIVIKNKEIYEIKEEISSVFWILRDDNFKTDIYMFEVLPNKKTKLIDLVESGITFISVAHGIREMLMYCKIPDKAAI